MRRVFLAVTLLSTGCGYTLQGSHSPLLEKEGIRKVFVAPLTNGTYKVGIENVVYNALVKTIASHRRVVLVSSKEDADAVLNGSIVNAVSNVTASSAANTLDPPEAGPSTILLATEYSATLTCAFSLTRKHPPRGKRAVVWESSFARSKPFRAAALVGVLGQTSALINESEFDRALSDLALSMMGDLHESMLAMF